MSDLVAISAKRVQRQDAALRKSLTPLACVLIALALLLTLAAKMHGTRSEGVVYIGKAVESDFVRVLGVSPDQAHRLVELRKEIGTRHSVGLFLQSAEARGIIVDSTPIRRSSLAWRTPQAAAFSFLIRCILLFVAFAWTIKLARRSGQYDETMIVAAFVLSGIGSAVLFSIQDPIRELPVSEKHIFGVLVGLAVAFVASRYRNIFLSTRSRYLGCLVSLAILTVLGILSVIARKPRIELFGVQPVELVKLLLIVFMAGYLAEFGERLAASPRRFLCFRVPRPQDIIPLLLIVLLPLLLMVIVRDLGPIVLISLTMFALFYVVTGRAFIPIFGLAVLIGVGTCAYCGGSVPWLGELVQARTFIERVDMWRSPWNNSHGCGMQVGQSIWAITTNGLIGAGPGLGSPGSVQVVRSDMIFAAVCEEYGFVGATLILTLLASIVVLGISNARTCASRSGQYLLAGLALLFGIQSALIVAGVLGLLPLTGITVPLLSAGGTSQVATFFVLALLAFKGHHRRIQADSILIGNVARRMAIAAGALALILVVPELGRVLYLQTMAANDMAVRRITVPDAQGAKMSCYNPRLTDLLRGIGRGSIYDRDGSILATSKEEELSRLGVHTSHRYYPLGAAAFHAVGHNYLLWGGPCFAEAKCDGRLSGRTSDFSVLSAYRRKDIPFLARPVKPEDIRLTIDSRVQVIVDRALSDTLRELRQRSGRNCTRGAAVFMDAETGEILALVSRPALDPNSLSQDTWNEALNEHGDRPLIDRARVGFYPPGSTFKLVTAAAALEKGVDPAMNCTGHTGILSWSWNGKTYSRGSVEDSTGPHGNTSIDRALEMSCNVYFSQLAVTLGADAIFDQIKAYGFRRPRSVGSVAERLPDAGFGQGNLLVSPWEMCRVVASIANEGIAPPQVPVWCDQPGTTRSIRVMPDSVAARLAKDMERVVISGTARGVFGRLPVQVSGKTGSAENLEGDCVPHSWFVGYSRVHGRCLAFAVIVENGGHGRGPAATVVRDVLADLAESRGTQ